MAISDSIKSFFRNTKPAARLAEIEAAIGAAEAERAQHNARRPIEIVGKLTGDADAAARVEAIDQALVSLDARLRDLRDGAGELRRRMAVDEEAARQREAEARPKRIAELRRAYMADVQAVTSHAEGMAAALKATSQHADALKAELGDEIALSPRFLDFGPRMRRLQSGIARLFQIDPARSLDATNSLIGIASGERGDRFFWLPTDHEQTGLDDIVPFFDSQTEAEASRDRLAARNTKVIVLPLPGGCYMLVREDQVFGDRAAAEQAARAAATRGKELAIIAHDGGFVAVGARFVWGT